MTTLGYEIAIPADVLCFIVVIQALAFFFGVWVGIQHERGQNR